MTTGKAALTKTVRVKLIKPHQHGGIDHPAGATIKVRPLQAVWLQERGIIQAPTPTQTEE
ncbi:MAG: hypothetical protein Q7U98_17250 [Methylicorpusculum sp.]|uniref:DUF7210 family protein n=1 Tax=Methylicorpusculum sp. TaxID=2713644 RepID=UPI002716B7D6|nr:hypothetical protein [Methylicorpusculum sp.]MDO8940904.1 hypothetical protein [Methylicorpusculum sp.]MDP2202405.1 hypothetical protein [Methylicorpusculum sp.]